MPPRNPRQQRGKLEELMKLQMHMVTLALQGVKVKEIAKALSLSHTVVQGFLASELGRSLLGSLRDKVAEKSIDLRLELEELAKQNLDIPKQILSGRIKEVRKTEPDEDGNQAEYEVERNVEPELRLKAFVEISKLAGFGGAKPPVQQNVYINFERLEKIKNRAREQGLLAEAETIEVEDA
ncbi:MAG: hypothetical protein MUP27_16255 [Desulfobacterales bacterium]|nr:hypothetical protein [Desulfobacterales bacterium]